MLFNSYEFICLFFPAAVGGYFFLGHVRSPKLAKVWLVLCSLFFYSYWNVKYLPLLIISITVNYVISGAIMKYRKYTTGLLTGKLFFIIGLVFDAGLLCVYKYMDFFIENINFLMGKEFVLWHIMLPLGISFFTITQMVYLVDCYEGVAKEHDLVNYSLFVSFFPHLLAGPILYHRAMMKQFNDEELRHIDWENMSRGFSLFIIGLAKKIIIADSFIGVVSVGFGNTAALTLVDSWIVAVSYFFQLYFDFSGYSDMAVGIAKMLNLDIPINFDSPYRQRNIISFWQHWHMSLTTTITNYLYTPMVMACKDITFSKAMIATFAAMFIAGIWHGAGWTFVIFGSIHAVGLVVCHIWKHYKLSMPAVFSHGLTLLWVMIATVFFRADTVGDACTIIAAMFGGHGIILLPRQLIDMGDKRVLLFSLLLSVVLTAFVPNSNQLVKNIKPRKKVAIILAVLLVYVMFNFNHETVFLYFQF